MKKTFLFLAALLTATVMNVRAEVLLNESFNYNVGDLTAKSAVDVSVTTTEWFYTTNTTARIQVVDTALTFKGYCSNKSAKAIQFKGNTNKAVRGISLSAKDSSIYYSVLLNVHEIKNSPTKDGIIMMHNVNSSAVGNCWAQLRYLNDNTAGTYSLGISKANEVGVRWITGLPKDSTILVVVRYDIIAGDKNDEVYMWINPTKLSEGSPTSWCVQDTVNPQNPTVKWGANQKADASTINRIFLKPAAHTPNMHLDEFRIATKWADLFEGAPTEPSLSVDPSSTSESYIFQGDSKEYTFTVSGKLLTNDVTITHTNAEVELSTASLTKEDVMDTTSFKATLTANAVGVQVDTIVLTSGTLVKKIPMAWNTIEVTACANVAAIKTAGAGVADNYVRLTGEAIVTRDTVISSVRELYMEDATGAVKLTDDYSILDAGSLVGAKIKDLLLVSNASGWGIQPFTVQGKPTIISTGNEVEPQVVTLAELQENAADYLLELVEIQGVAFATPDSTFKTDKQFAFSQDTKNANVKVENNSLVGVTVPVKANVIGFSFNTSGSVILPRGKEDIIDIYTRPATAGKFGTICLAKKIASMEGVDGLYIPHEKVENILYCEEISLDDVVAGGAYIFKANAAEVAFTLTGDAVSEPAVANNMIGWLKADSILTDEFIDARPDCYILGSKGGEQKLYRPQATSTLKKNCAMVNVNIAAPTAPARGRLISFGVNTTNTPTGMIDVNANVNANRKMMRNGQLIIMKNGRMFNAQGQEL